MNLIKVVHKKTWFIESVFENINMHQKFWIDNFPYDAFSNNENDNIWTEIMNKPAAWILVKLRVTIRFCQKVSGVF